MNNLTYRELLRQLSAMSEEWLDANVTVYLEGVDEYLPIKRFLINSSDDVLDEGHPFLEIAE